eukprot:g161.t1
MNCPNKSSSCGLIALSEKSMNLIETNSSSNEKRVREKRKPSCDSIQSEKRIKLDNASNKGSLSSLATVFSTSENAGAIIQDFEEYEEEYAGDTVTWRCSQLKELIVYLLALHDEHKFRAKESGNAVKVQQTESRVLWVPPEEIEKLSREVVLTILASKQSRKEVATKKDTSWVNDLAPYLKQLVPVLSQVITDASNVNLFMSARTLETQKTEEEKMEGNCVLQSLLEAAIEAAIATTTIMNIENIDRRIFPEEYIENVVQFCKSTMTKLIFPVHDALKQKEQFQLSTSRQQILSSTAITTTTTKSVQDAENKKKSKKTVSKIQGVETFGKRMTTRIGLLIDNISKVLKIVLLPDHLLLQLSSLCLSSFTVQGKSINSIQRKCIDVLRIIYQKYPKYRIVLFEDIISLLPQLPSTKKSIRTYQLFNTPTNIQMISALILQMLQVHSHISHSLLSEQSLTGTTENEENDEIGLNPEKGRNEKTIRRILSHFLSLTLKRCNEKENGIVYRKVFENILQDALFLFDQLEWPIAELVIECFATSIGKFLPSNSNSEKCSIQLHVAAIRMIGNICSCAQGEYVRYKSDPIEISINKDDKIVNENANPGEKDEKIECTCDIKEVDDLMLDCDICHSWFHAKCQGFQSVEQIPERWECENCKIKAAVLEQIQRKKERSTSNGISANCNSKSKKRRKKKSKSENTVTLSESEDENDCDENNSSSKVDTNIQQDVMEQLLLNYLTEQSYNNNIAFLARQFYLQRWSLAKLEEKKSRNGMSLLLLEDRINFYQTQWRLPDEKIRRTKPQLTLSRATTQKIWRSMIAERPLLQASRRLLLSILTVLSSRKIKFRAEALKVLNGILDADPTVMTDSIFQNAVKARLRDSAISVREAAVEIIGSYISNKPEYISIYYKSFLERLTDTGISVRRKVIHVLRNILLLNDKSQSYRLEIITQMISRLDHDCNDTREYGQLIETFRLIWFENIKFARSFPQGKEKKKRDYEIQKRNVAFVVDEIISVVGTMQSSDHLLLLFQQLNNPVMENDGKNLNEVSEHLHDNLNRENVGKINLQTKENCFSKITNGLFEKILSLEENLSQSNETSLKLVLSLELMCIFSRVDAYLVIPHIQSLSTYLSGDALLSSEDQSDCILYVTEIIENCLSHLIRPSKQFINSLKDDLSTIIMQREPFIVAAASKCFTQLAKITNDVTPLVTIMNRFYRFLFKYHQNIDAKQIRVLSIPTVSSIQRAIYVLGLLSRDYNFNDDNENGDSINSEKIVENENTEKETIQLTNELVVGKMNRSMYEIIVLYCNASHLGIQSQSIRALFCLCSRNPRFLLQKATSIHLRKSLKSKQVKLRGIALESLREMLQWEEKRLESNETKMKLEDSHTTADMVRCDQAADSAIFMSFLASFMKRIYDSLFDKSLQIRRAAIRLLEVVMRQGIINPMTCLTKLIALQTGDIDNLVRSHAMTIINSEHLNNNALVSICAAEGIIRGFYYSTKVALESRDFHVYNNFQPSFVSQLYATCLQTPRKRQQSFIRSILAYFDPHRSGLPGAKLLQNFCEKSNFFGNIYCVKLLLLRYLAKVLMVLPYAIEEEVLFVIEQIERLISLRHGVIEEELSEINGKIQNVQSFHTKKK